MDMRLIKRHSPQINFPAGSACLLGPFPSSGLQDCIERLKKTYGLHLAVEDGVKPLGVFRSCLMSTLTLVTTAEFLADPMSPRGV